MPAGLFTGLKGLIPDELFNDLTTKSYVDTTAAAQNVVSSTTATNSAITVAGHVRYTNPIAGDSTTIVNDVAIANGVQILADQPDYPRKLTMVITDANASISAGIVTFIGIGASGQALNQAIDISVTGTHTYTTADCYASVTSITVSALAGATGADKIKVGPSDALGLPAMVSPVPGTFVVYKANVGNDDEVVGTVDATAGSIVPTTAPDGAKIYDFWYKYAYTPVQASHTHTLS